MAAPHLSTPKIVSRWRWNVPRSTYLVSTSAGLSAVLTKRGSTMLQTPFAMNKSLMGKVAQLSDYDETLYKVALDRNSRPAQFAARNSVRNYPTASPPHRR